MENFLKSATFNLLSLCVGLVGIFLAVYFYFRTRRDVRLIYSVRSFNLIKDRREILPHLQVTYHGEAIANATVSKLLLVNSGDVPITALDVPAAEPITVSIRDGTILDISVSSNNNTSNAIKLVCSSAEQAVISFEYLNPKDGAVIRILHTAASNSDVQLIGKIIGFGGPKRVMAYSLAPRLTRIFTFPLLSEERSKRLSQRANTLRWAMLFATLIFTVGLAIFLIKAPELDIKPDTSPMEFRWVIAIVVIVTLVPYGWIVFRLFRFSLPKGLEDFYDFI